MADEAIAVIVAGSGKVTEKEVTDLLEDYLQEWDDVQLIVPISKSLFTDAVTHALTWWDDDKSAIAVKVDGENANRAGARVGDDTPEEFPSFTGVFEDEFEGFDAVEFFIAMPDPEDEDAYDEAADWVAAALESTKRPDIKVKNLCAGLDDVVLAEPDPETEAVYEPDEEPLPPKVETKPRARKSRAKAKADPEPEEIQHEINKAAASVDRTPSTPDAVTEALGVLGDTARYLFTTDQAYALYHGEPLDTTRPFTQKYWDAYQVLLKFFEGTDATTDIPEAEKAPESPRKGRGRPRTQFEVKEIYDEDTEAWVPRPRGRIAKGTKWRVRHDETQDILDEGEQA